MNARPDTIYIVKPIGHDGPYKVGCSTNVLKRVRSLSNASALPLELVCAVPGGVEVERRIHALLRHSHTRCEWFDDCAEIRELIAAINAGEFDADALPDPIRIDALINGLTAVQRRELAGENA